MTERREYIDINPYRRRLPAWLPYAGLTSLIAAAVAVVILALGQ